ncbi:MAG TPA: hypothetical protein VJR89_10195 [Polyangiales bacterium]|nr:hypothetical protein [Polyangiales bacterium]
MADAVARSIDSPLPVPVVMWRDVFALVDQGQTKAEDYPILEALVRDQAERHPGGLACLVIIPPTASPPPDDVRRAISDVLSRLAPKLRCLSWLVEGSGFRAAAVRATLAGLRMWSRPPYPTLVASDLGEALRWMLPHLENGPARLSQIPEAVESITHGRRSIHPGAS